MAVFIFCRLYYQLVRRVHAPLQELRELSCSPTIQPSTKIITCINTIIMFVTVSGSLPFLSWTVLFFYEIQRRTVINDKTTGTFVTIKFSGIRDEGIRHHPCPRSTFAALDSQPLAAISSQLVIFTMCHQIFLYRRGFKLYFLYRTPQIIVIPNLMPGLAQV